MCFLWAKLPAMAEARSGKMTFSKSWRIRILGSDIACSIGNLKTKFCRQRGESFHNPISCAKCTLGNLQVSFHFETPELKEIIRNVFLVFVLSRPRAVSLYGSPRTVSP